MEEGKMKPKALLASFLFLAVIGLVVGASFAAEDPGGQAPAPRPGKKYDPKTVETVRGEVVKVQKIERHGRSFLSLVLKTEKGEIPVHLGPSRFLDEQGFRIEPKDNIEVKGARANHKGKPFLIAAELKKGETILKLRDENGVPVWRRQKQG
jgi:hypothetical protein